MKQKNVRLVDQEGFILGGHLAEFEDELNTYLLKQAKERIEKKISEINIELTKYGITEEE